MPTFLRDKTISKMKPLWKENLFPQFNVAYYKRPGSGCLLNTQQHCFQGKGEREEDVKKNASQVCNFCNSFVQDGVQGDSLFLTKYLQ